MIVLKYFEHKGKQYRIARYNDIIDCDYCCRVCYSVNVQVHKKFLFIKWWKTIKSYNAGIEQRVLRLQIVNANNYVKYHILNK